MKIKTFVIDDDQSIRRAIRFTLDSEEYEFIEADSISKAYSMITEDKAEYDIMLLDMHLSDGSGIHLFKRLNDEGHFIPTIIISGAASAKEAADAIKLGVYDFLEKPISKERLEITIRRCLDYHQVKNQLESSLTTHTSFNGFVGESGLLRAVRQKIEQFAYKDVKILLTGETGVGKDVVAQSIWKKSSRADRPLIVLNSSAVPENLVESELFGHKKGSFTGAIKDQIGKIEMANRGTLFLDEVGDLSQAAQTKLLRFLETGEIQSIGSSECKKVDVRLIAATSRNLEIEMRKGRFREDLYFRLNVVEIFIAPLRERTEDISAIFNHFVLSYCDKFSEPEKKLGEGVLEVLGGYNWPGNVRELRNVAERSVLASGKLIQKAHIVEALGSRLSNKEGALEELEIYLPLKEYKTKSEFEYIQKVLKKTGGSVTEAAKILDVDRSYLHQKMTKLNIRSVRSR